VKKSHVYLSVNVSPHYTELVIKYRQTEAWIVVRMWLNIKAKWKMFTDGSGLRQGGSKFSGGGACAQLRWWAPVDFKPKIVKNTFTYNIANQVANLKLNHSITILTVVCDSPNRTILKCSFACLLSSHVTHTSVKTTSAVCMARRLVTKSTIWSFSLF